MCALEAPDVFDVPRDPPVRLVGAVTDANADAVRLAVRYCPTGAIKLEDD
jgi:ferredoxin